MAIGSVGSSGINDWLAASAWGASLRTNNAETNSTSKAQKTTLNAVNAAVDPFSADALRTKAAQTRTISQAIRGDQIQQKQRVHENARVQENTATGQDLFSQLYALYQSPQTLADIQPARISMSSYDMAKMQEERDDPELKNAAKQMQSFDTASQESADETEDDGDADDVLLPSSSQTHSVNAMDAHIQAAYLSYRSATEEPLPALHTLIG